MGRVDLREERNEKEGEGGSYWERINKEWGVNYEKGKMDGRDKYY